MRACTVAVTQQPHVQTPQLPFVFKVIIVHHCQGTHSILTLDSRAYPSILKAVEELEEAGPVLRECSALLPPPHSSRDAVCCISAECCVSAVHTLCVPDGTRHGSRFGNGPHWHALAITPLYSFFQGFLHIKSWSGTEPGMQGWELSHAVH